MTGDPPVVSVVTIFLNAERFMEEAIESLLAQTYEQWELLLVDDGSTDRSTEIAYSYVQRHPDRIRYFEHDGHTNRGMSASRNVGMHNARGNYIAFLDADDVWLPNKLGEQVSILDSRPEVAMVYGLSQFWFSWTGRPEDCDRDFAHQLGVLSGEPIQPPGLLSRFFLAQDAAIPGPTDVLVRREAVEQVQGFEEVFRGSYEDEAFYAKICLHAAVIPVDTVWDRYRQHQASSTTAMEMNRQEYAARLFFLTWLGAYLHDHGFRDADVLASLQDQIWRCQHPTLFRLRGMRRGLISGLVLQIARRLAPAPIRHWLWTKWRRIEYRTPVGWVRLGSLGRRPLSRDFGFDRGQPVDRYYIERFLAEHSADICGHVLEVEDDVYTRRFGCNRVTKSDVLHVQAGAPKATIVADLSDGMNLPADTFDCIILTQTLQYIYNARAAVESLHRMLKPGGVVLATVPGICQISRYDMERWGQYWSFTSQSARRLFADVFPASGVAVEAHGNVLSATALLYGMASQELRFIDLDYRDPEYEVCITVRAVKPRAEPQSQATPI